MSYDAKVFNVMIASPGDVDEERKIVREVIYEWNTNHSSARKIVLLPIGWETHSIPKMGDHPQNILNEQILEIADIVVGVFWTRLGTPTDKHPSGTVEEIEEHTKSGKLAMLYFSNKHIPRDADRDECNRVDEFKKQCQKKGLYREYTDFKETFSGDLQRLMNDDEFKSQTVDIGAEEASFLKLLGDSYDLEGLYRIRQGRGVLEIDGEGFSSSEMSKTVENLKRLKLINVDGRGAVSLTNKGSDILNDLKAKELY